MKKRVMKKRIRGAFFNLGIASQIAIYCFLLFAMTFLVSNILNQQIYKKISLDQANDTIQQMLNLVDNNIQSVVGSINETSKTIISNKKVRLIMRSRSFTDDIQDYNEVINYIRSILDNMSYATSVHLFNNTSKPLNIGIRSINYPISDNITDAFWYDTVSEKMGDYKLVYKGGGFFNNHTGDNFVSMVRLFVDIETQQCNGVQVVNFSTKIIETAFEDLIKEYGMHIMVSDEHGNLMVTTDERIGLDDVSNDAQTSPQNYVIKDIGGVEYMIASRQNSYGWNILAMVPMSNITAELDRFSYMTLIFILINGLLMFIGISFISRLVTHPVKQLVDTMKDIKKGRLEPFNIKSGNHEIRLLRDGYNRMAGEINTLFDKVVEEQEMIRESELRLLQSQIKPHFLYNTFDAISSLSLMNKNKEVYEAMLALGSLYRTNLSKGRDVITLGEEVEATKNYLKILKIRYEDTFCDLWNIDEKANDMLLPKLTLQPIVENALYHGIKPKGEKGVIKVSTKLTGGQVELRVEDDGVGMSQDVVQSILSKEGLSFGVRGTVERLRMVCRCHDVMEIRTQLGVGTTIIITIPAIKDGDQDDKE